MIQKIAIARKTCNVAICAAFLAWGGMSIGAESQPGEYRPNDFLGLDLPTAVLSPKRLGPTTQFAPVKIEDASGDAGQQAGAETNSVPDKPAPDKVVADKADAGNPDAELYSRSARVAARVAKPRGASRVKLARQQHGNPLDAQASDTRIQVWPCRSGGICNWQRQ